MRLRVTDVNDNTPNCLTIQPIFISRNHNPHKIIGWVNAYDKDDGANGMLTYRLQQFDELFEIKPKGI